MKISKKSKKYLVDIKRQVSNIIKDTFFLKKSTNIYLHQFSKSPAVEYLIVPNKIASEKDIYYADRLLVAYHKAIEDYSNSENDLWTINSKHQSKFFNLLKNNNPRDLAQYLCNMNKEDATIGTVQGNYEYERLLNSSRYRRFVAVMAKDKLVSLAEALGVLPVENPEQGTYGKNIHEDCEILYNKICLKVECDIAPPDIDGGLLKLKVGTALFNERDCNAIYTGFIIKDAKKICEIGGGSGRVCLWGSTFGISEYTILDLPHINVIQGFYLLKSLDERVGLYGEAVKQIRILPCHHLPDERFDLVLNQDSFPEIGENTVINYLKWIQKHADTFLSINHESKPPYPGSNHINVNELIEKVSGFKQLYRNQYWIRKGYTMEKYSTKNV